MNILYIYSYINKIMSQDPKGEERVENLCLL